MRIKLNRRLSKEDLKFLETSRPRRTLKVAPGVNVRLRRPTKLKITPELKIISVRDRAAKRHVRPVLNRTHHDPKAQVPVEELCERVVALSQVLAEKKFYPYQIKFAYRVVESLLLHDGDTLTALMARQSGKTEVVGSIVAALALILPTLAKMLPLDWRLNITDNNGVYRGFRAGISIGIYAPRMDQAQTMFDRVNKALDTDSAKQVLKELKIELVTKNGQKIVMSNKSTILCQSASVQSKIEGKTHHLLIAEEAQEIDDLKMRKSLSPMLAATKGTMVMIGTATSQKCDFYTQIGNNERGFNAGVSVRNHFFFPYTITQRYNSQYAEYIEKEKVRLGEDSDEFRMSYECVWIFERGMFVTQAQLFQKEVALRYGPFSSLYEFGLPRKFQYYSLVAGIDWGRSHDSTVITIMAVDWNNPIDSGNYVNADGSTDYVHYKKHVIFWREFVGDDYETQYWEIYEWFKHLCQRGLKKIVLDANGCGIPMFDRFNSTFGKVCEVVPFSFQSRDKSDAYKYLYADISGKRVTFPCGSDVFGRKACRKFLQQMLDLRKEYKQGLMVVSHPKEKDAHDDYPDSLCLADWGCATPAMGSNVEYSDTNFLFN